MMDQQHWWKLLVSDKSGLINTDDKASALSWPVAYLRGGGAMRPCPSPPGKSENIFWRDTLFKMGFQTYIFCSKVPSKCRKCRFRDPNFKIFSGGHAPGPPYNFVVTMASPSLKFWLRYWSWPAFFMDNFSFYKFCMFMCRYADIGFRLSWENKCS